MATKFYDCVAAVDARIDVRGDKFQAVEIGPTSTTYRSVQANANNTLSPSFQIALPSFHTGLGRNPRWHQRGTITIVGPQLRRLLTGNRIALRSHCLQASCTSAVANLNDLTSSTPSPYLLVDTLTKMGNTAETLQLNSSGGSVGPDLTTNYESQVATGYPFDRANAAPYGSSIITSRTSGIVSVTVNEDTPVGGQDTLTLVYDVFEPVLIQPFEPNANFGGCSKALFGLTGVTIQFNQTEILRMLSLAIPVGGDAVSINSVNCVPSTNELLCSFVTPHNQSPVEAITPPLETFSYDFTSCQYYTQDFGAITAAEPIKSGSGNVFQFSTVPSLISVAVKRGQNSYGSKTTSEPDIYLPIKSITCSFNDQAGLLSSATPSELWSITVKNGSSVPWWLFSGERMYSSGANTTTVRSAGWPLLISTTGELNCSSSGCAPGQALKASFSITRIEVENQTGVDLADTRLEVVVFTPSVMYSQNGSSTLTSAPVPGTGTEAFQKASLVQSTAFDSMRRYGGWGSGWRDWLKKIGPFLSRAAKNAPEIVDRLGLPQLTLPAEAVKAAVTALGGKKMIGGGNLGGAKSAKGGAVLAGKATRKR